MKQTFFQHDYDKLALGVLLMLAAVAVGYRWFL